MVEEYRTNNQLFKRVAEVYKWLGLQIRNCSNLAGICDACGRCCDFAISDHRLFLTTPELMYLAAKVAGEKTKPMNGGRCPYNIDGKCSIYEYRFAGCRIFCCRGNSGFQSELSESCQREFKSICTEFQVPYRYADLADMLNDASGH